MTSNQQGSVRQVSIAETESDIEIRTMTAADAEAVLAFARALPVHDLLFLQRDIRNAKVVSAWIEQNERGQIRSLVAAASDGALCGCAAVVRDPLGWSPHVAEIRLVVAASARRAGLGRRLAQEALALAISDEVEKVIVRLVPDQRGAIALFEELGFRAEALLRDHVRDADGLKHDIAILSLDVLRQDSQHRVFGMGGSA